MLFRKIKDFCNITSSRQITDEDKAAYETLTDFFSHDKQMVRTGIRIANYRKYLAVRPTREIRIDAYVPWRA
jgi:hypothetical protein